MRIKSIFFMLVCFLLSGLTLPAIACPPFDCGDCRTWNAETETCDWDCDTGYCCEDDSCVSSCPGCKTCDGEHCQDDNNECSTCKECDDGNCVLKSTSECDVDSDCTGPCHNGCSSCSCVDDNSQCSTCQECDNGDCVLKSTSECNVNSDCETEEHCENCKCECDSGSCWEVDTVSPSSEVCEDCSSFTSGCVGLVEIIPFSYQIWVEVAPGGYGYCKNPTKIETVGTLNECTEDWDVTQIVACAAESVLCGSLCSTTPWYVCVACLVLEGIDCALDGLCVFVEDCIPGDAVTYVDKNVVDFGGEFGDFRKCGSSS